MELNPPPKSPIGWYRTARSSLARRRAAQPAAGTPYLDDETLRVLTRELAETPTLIEYGSGSSTLFAAARTHHVISVETDKRYAAQVQAAAEGAAGRVWVTYVNIGLVEDWGVPLLKGATRRRVTAWQQYAHAPWRLLATEAAPQPRLALVDGRFRVASAAVSLIELTGVIGAHVLVDDYAVRPEYWALEAVADLEERAGRSALFAPRPGQEARLAHVAKEYQHDWR